MRFELAAAPAAETWTRHFPGRTMRSRLSGDACVVEDLGPARLTFALVRSEASLRMRLVRLQFLRLPCPRWLLPRVLAEERGEPGVLHFHVEATVPLLGRVAGYRGWLQLPSLEDPT
ncbi:DUF4166 domain-containing protein [Ramlibacter cellulosilyticus]|uniref:DUF4166 domain-containing protein n=1 Tax=Ramlibacter cellulosilyticus TaxID=2764187 RepID=UPI003F49422D